MAATKCSYYVLFEHRIVTINERNGRRRETKESEYGLVHCFGQLPQLMPDLTFAMVTLCKVLPNETALMKNNVSADVAVMAPNYVNEPDEIPNDVLFVNVVNFNRNIIHLDYNNNNADRKVWNIFNIDDTFELDIPAAREPIQLPIQTPSPARRPRQQQQ